MELMARSNDDDHEVRSSFCFAATTSRLQQALTARRQSRMKQILAAAVGQQKVSRRYSRFVVGTHAFTELFVLVVLEASACFDVLNMISLRSKHMATLSRYQFILQQKGWTRAASAVILFAGSTCRQKHGKSIHENETMVLRHNTEC